MIMEDLSGIGPSPLMEKLKSDRLVQIFPRLVTLTEKGKIFCNSAGFLSEDKRHAECKSLVVDPEINNQGSIGFFEKAGFKFHQVIEAKDALGRQRNYLLMIKKMH